MEFKVIDFHTHPFDKREHNICDHTDFCNMSLENSKEGLQSLGISKICGTVIKIFGGVPSWQEIQALNDEALLIRDKYGDFYCPGFHVHPAYVKESIAEIFRMKNEGVKLIGELVPYTQGWNDYSCPEFSEILDAAEECNMLVSFHSMGEDQMDAMVKKHPNVTFIAAHPGEYPEFMRHMERMKFSDNYYLDLSGYGILRYGMIRHAVDLFGPEKFIFGSDYPTCNPAMYLGAVRDDYLLTDEEKKLILSENAERLLKKAFEKT